MADRAEYEDLARLLSTLGNANRLGLLRQLRRPRHVSEIRFTPESPRQGENPERVVTRQAVRHHLEKLLAVDVVQLHKRGPAFEGDEFLVNHRQVFAVAEQLRDLARMDPSDAPYQRETRPTVPTLRPQTGRSRALVLVHGVEEGRSWALGPGTTLRVGRAKDAEVRLDYDPFISSWHAEVSCTPTEVLVTDLGSRNGVLLNWTQLGPKKPTALTPGDVIGIGRSSLVYRG